ncbi:hypothetical protein HNR31_002247 [Anoxybacillus caldiproteolyticus]|uniref:Uncharacterized protein n=1 Tax=Thermaerobacillus caldiproteolyticus TaxID=247480 RepID=A0A7V9Z7M1_9BACL|nr:hypothetical protein [Anoxybacillus caldiproteolyticus]
MIETVKSKQSKQSDLERTKRLLTTIYPKGVVILGVG